MKKKFDVIINLLTPAVLTFFSTDHSSKNEITSKKSPISTIIIINILSELNGFVMPIGISKQIVDLAIISMHKN